MADEASWTYITRVVRLGLATVPRKSVRKCSSGVAVACLSKAPPAIQKLAAPGLTPRWRELRAAPTCVDLHAGAYALSPGTTLDSVRRWLAETFTLGCRSSMRRPGQERFSHHFRRRSAALNQTLMAVGALW